MRGHARRRGTSWEFIVDAGRHPAQRCRACKRRVWVDHRKPRQQYPGCGGALREATLERRQHSKAGFRTRKLAEAVLRSFLTEVDAGGDPFAEDVTLSDYLHVPLPEGSVDVVLSNCVIALSVDKDAVFSEAHRVLRPGGRLAVADVVAVTEHPAEQPADAASWVDCVRGALTPGQYRAALEAAGFVDVTIQTSHPVRPELLSVIVRASKPAQGARRAT